MDCIELPINEIVPKLTINVKITGARAFWLRKRVGLWLLKVSAYAASFIGNLDIHVQV